MPFSNPPPPLKFFRPGCKCVPSTNCGILSGEYRAKHPSIYFPALILFRVTDDLEAKAGATPDWSPVNRIGKQTRRRKRVAPSTTTRPLAIE